MQLPTIATGLLVLFSMTAMSSGAAIEARDDPINTNRDDNPSDDAARHPACWRHQRDIGATCHNGGSGGEIFTGINDHCKGYAKCIVAGAPSYFCPITPHNVANCNACIQGGGSRPCPTV